MSVDEMKQDATVTLNWFRMNVPTIIVIIGLGFYVGTNMTTLQHSVNSLKYDNESLKSTTADINKIVYRVEQLEVGLHKANERTDSLQNTLLSGMDLMRRDINRLTTHVEVLSSRVGMFIGDVEEPKQRRARPAPPSLD
ncbi:MAG TPA: hypothetical protein VL020_02945 [Pseudomonadales bacterium]|nr:hypothetical protein [Pseudomonadales bacterium]